MKRTRKSRVKILQDVQQKYYMDKLDKEKAEAEKLKEKTRPVAEAAQNEEDTKRKREDEETMESKRMKLVIARIDDTIMKMNQFAIENELVNTAHGTVRARKSGYASLVSNAVNGKHVLAR